MFAELSVIVPSKGRKTECTHLTSFSELPFGNSAKHPGEYMPFIKFSHVNYPHSEIRLDDFISISCSI